MCQNINISREANRTKANWINAAAFQEILPASRWRTGALRFLRTCDEASELCEALDCPRVELIRK